MIEINFIDGLHGWYRWPENKPPEDEHIIALCKCGGEYSLMSFCAWDEDIFNKEMLESGAIAWTHNVDLTDIVLQLLQNKPLQ